MFKNDPSDRLRRLAGTGWGVLVYLLIGGSGLGLLDGAFSFYGLILAVLPAPVFLALELFLHPEKPFERAGYYLTGLLYISLPFSLLTYLSMPAGEFFSTGDYDPMRGIEYQGLKFTLNKAPVTGDTFRLDGNHDGTGNNQTMLDLVALQSKKVIGGVGGRTIAEAYEEAVGKVGNFSNQATIAQKALQVVNDQAVAARDKVSGVSLDNEAADLIRFQQAYQASAKAMQVANTLFDAILQVCMKSLCLS